MTTPNELNRRSSDVLKHIVDAYVETGAPVGSKALSGRLGMKISSATIRNVMAELEALNLLYSPHTSAGRLPTEKGLQFFVNGLLEVGDVSVQDRAHLEEGCQSQGQSLDQLLEGVTTTLSGLSQCAGLVMAPKIESTLKHMEFVALSPGRTLVVLITQEGTVENRIMETDLHLSQSSLIEAGNYLNQELSGKTLTEVRSFIGGLQKQNQSQLDQVAQSLVEKGLAMWSGEANRSSLIVRGQSNLLQDVRQIEEVARLRELFTAMDKGDDLLSLVDQVISAEGVQIFIGAENELFHHTGCSVIVSPYSNASGRVVGAIGIIGPSRMNYSRIIPMVDYTAKLIGRKLGQ